MNKKNLNWENYIKQIRKFNQTIEKPFNFNVLIQIKINYKYQLL
jgi:hypothetical protein